MNTSTLQNMPKIYLTCSDKARLAECRARIVRESSPLEPCYNEDLVFEKAENGFVPDTAIYSWRLEPYGVTFYTTPERCKQLVSEDPSYWTEEKLKKFAEIEKRLYQDWYNGHVYGYIIEKWDEKSREWKNVSSLWGMYGAEELMLHLTEEIDFIEEIDGVSIPICIDEEEMAYEFGNAEKIVNEFA